MPEIKKGNNSAKNLSGVTFLISAKWLVMLYICTKFREIISNGIKVIEQTQFLYEKLQRGIILQNKLGGVTIFNLCMLSGHVLYFYEVL